MKLSPGVWTGIIAFQLAYGLAVFALTRAHYLREPPAAGSARLAPAPPRSDLAESMLRFGQPALPAGSAAQLEQAGDTYFAQQRYAEAATAYRRALDLAPGSAELHNNLGITLHYLGQGQEAMARLKDGAALDPKLQRIWLTLGFVQAANGLADEARPNLRKAIQLDPRSEIGQEAQRILQQLP